MFSGSPGRGEEIYRNFARFYDRYVDGFDADFALYLPMTEPGHQVLEVGCGTGRILKPLLERGCRVTGVDISPDMLALAHSKLIEYVRQGDLQLILHNLVTQPLPDRYDRVLVTFYTFNYLLTEEEARTFLVHAGTGMSPGAVLVMDLFYPLAYLDPAREGKWQERAWRHEGKEVKLLDRRSMQGSLEKRVQVYGGRREENTITTYRRFYTKPEIHHLLKETGFGSIYFTDTYDPETFHQLSAAESTENRFAVMATRRE